MNTTNNAYTPTRSSNSANNSVNQLTTVASARTTHPECNQRHQERCSTGYIRLGTRVQGGNNTTIFAYYAADASINGSVKIYFRAPTASWTGYVVDSYGTGYGGITVTLHVRRRTEH